MSIVTRVVAAAAMVFLSAGVAATEPAAIERTAKLRSGPGTHYRALATVPRGAMVELIDCTAFWCNVSWRGRRGYVVHSTLDVAPSSTAVAIGPGSAFYVTPGPSYYYDDYPGFDYPGYAYAPNASVSPAPRWNHQYGRWSGRNFRRGGWAGRQAPVGSVGSKPQLGGVAPQPLTGTATAPRATEGATTGSIKSATPSVATPPVSAPPATARSEK